MKMKSVGVFLLILVLLEVMCCEGCWKQERDGLLALNSHMGYPLPWHDDTDCCQWEGVECNATTGRVAKLELSDSRSDWRRGYWLEVEPWHLNYSDFKVFKDLKSLNLSHNKIADCAAIEGMENLEVLDLSGNNFDNATSILSCLDGLSSLKSLSLQYTDLAVTSSHLFETLSSKLLHLEVLDTSGNDNLKNNILPSLRGFTSLNELYLSDIGLDSDLHIRGLCAMLKNLEVLDISRNNFDDTDIASALSGLSSLKSLTLEGSQITPRSIHNISKLRTLEILDLARNNLDLWLRENDGFSWPTSIQVLVLSSNSLSNNILSSLTGLQRLKSLDLSDNRLEGSLDISGLSNLSRLKILDFANNQVNDFVVKGSKSLCKLEVLALDGNMINGSKLQELLRAFSSIRVLTLAGNDFTGTILTGDWSKLKKLEELDLSNNEFVGSLPSFFVNMTSLRKLTLDDNHFSGNIVSNLASLTSLEYLSFERNRFEVPISFTPFSNHSNLKFVHGNGNKVILDSHSALKTWVPKFQLQLLELSSIVESNSIPLPNFLFYQYALTRVDFTGCKLGGEFPNWLLENNTKMVVLVLENCSFTGDFHLPSRPHPSMETIGVSNNAITGQMLSNNISSIFPNLVSLNMSTNAISGLIPCELSQMSSLDTLDLSDNHLSGEIPYNLSGDGHQLRFLKLSNNMLNGPMPPILSTFSHLEYLLLDGNNISGSIPSGFFNSSNIKQLDISNNHFTGKIPSDVNNSVGLLQLQMSNNHFEGSIPSELAELKYIMYLDLSENNLTGCVPSFVNSSVMFIHLSNNHLTGLSKRMFNEESSVVLLDLSYNDITNGIQDLTHDLGHTMLSILLMKGNHFTGNISNQLCQLTDLSILDLSLNSFSGAIPSCLGKMPFEKVDDHLGGLFYGFRGGFDFRPYPYPPVLFIQEKANFTSKERSETYTKDVLLYMSGIDLSHNNLNGNIPSELGNLTRIRALNLSHNYLTGKIPAMFSKLVQVESLDLSFNLLSGQIPTQLSGLTSLEVFSVAYNNLSGATPERKGQFSTFEERSYEGNQFLCGPPLSKSCNANGQTSGTLPNGMNTDEDNDSWVDMYVFRVSFVVAYTSVLLVIAAVLYINPYWRQAWFYYIELVGMNCYYFIEDNLFKFF